MRCIWRAPKSRRGLPFALLSLVLALSSYLYPLFGPLVVFGERQRVGAVYPFLYPSLFWRYPMSPCLFYSLYLASAQE